LGLRSVGLTGSTAAAALVILGVGLVSAMVLTKPAPSK
jgi:hypothetical protein